METVRTDIMNVSLVMLAIVVTVGYCKLWNTTIQKFQYYFNVSACRINVHLAGRCIVGTFPMGYECINDECCSITEVSVGNEHIVLFCCMCLLSFRSFKDAPIGQNNPGLAR